MTPHRTFTSRCQWAQSWGARACVSHSFIHSLERMMADGELGRRVVGRLTGSGPSNFASGVGIAPRDLPARVGMHEPSIRGAGRCVHGKPARHGSGSGLRANRSTGATPCSRHGANPWENEGRDRALLSSRRREVLLQDTDVAASSLLKNAATVLATIQKGWRHGCRCRRQVPMLRLERARPCSSTR
jgi:hypothetical protein